MKLSDALTKKEKTLQAIIKDLRQVRNYLVAYAKITDDTDTQDVLDTAKGKEEQSIQKKRKPAIKKISFVAEDFSAESYDTEENFFRIAGIIDDLIINLQRLHSEKGKKKKYYTDDDFETEKVYKVKDGVLERFGYA